MVDNDESQIPQEKSGENCRPIFHSRGDNQQKSNRKCKERRTEAGPFCVRIVWMVMMKPMKASARRIMMKDNSVHQIFKQRPGSDARQDQIETIHASQVQENHYGKRYGDEVAEASKSPHHLSGKARGSSCSPHWIGSPAPSAPIMDLQPRDGNRFPSRNLRSRQFFSQLEPRRQSLRPLPGRTRR
jgi:hypothetical protein